MMDDHPTLDDLDSALRLAIDAGDARAESVARVNLACAALQMDSPDAGVLFEEALSAVRRAQNPRSEGILSMMFGPWLVEQGDPVRGLELARRGEEIMRRGRSGQRVLSLIQLARVLYTGFEDAEEAGAAVDAAVAVLAEGPITHPTDRAVVEQTAAHAAKAALEAHDMDRTLALTRIIDPETADRLSRATRPSDPGLSDGQNDEIESLCRSWSRRHDTEPDARVATMAGKIEDLLGWTEARARAAGVSGGSDAVRALVDRARAVALQTVTVGDAASADAPAVSDDDVVFVLALGTDPGWNTTLPAWATFELAGETAGDPALAARCFRLAAAIGHQQRDPRESRRLFQRAEALLAPGVDDALLAEVVLEVSVCELNLGRAEPALSAAQRAVELARRVGNDRLGRMAQGNVANAFLQLRRVPEALEIFEQLEAEQRAAGETDMAQVSRQNIEACREFLGQPPPG